MTKEELKSALKDFGSKGKQIADELYEKLEAEKETIISRIENDPIRDKNTQNQQKSKVDWQMRYLKTEYPDAVRINTENKSLDEIANEIMTLL